MVYVPDWEWVVSLAFAGLALPLAAFILLVAPSRAVNRTLSALLVAEGLMQGPTALLVGTPWGREHFAGLLQIFFSAVIAAPFLYLLFLGYALDTRWTRPLRARPIQVAIAIALVGFEIIPIIDPTVDVQAVARYALYGAAATATLGLVAALSADRRAEKGSVAARRARAYLVAFAARDLSFVLPTLFLTGGSVVTHFAPPLDAHFFSTWGGIARDLAALVFLAALAYGLLRVQIFDLDVKIHAGVKQGTIMTSFVAVYFLVNEMAQFFFQQAFGVYLGIGAAALLVFALHPVQQLAEKIASRAVPSAQPVEKMNKRQRIDVYREQVVVAWEDGTLSLKERRMLEVVRERLGLTLEEAVSLEREIWNRAGAAGAPQGAGA